MSQGNTNSSYASLLKEFYTEDTVVDSTFSKNAFLALVPKDEKIEGAHFQFPIIYAQGQGRSGTFTTAQTLALTSGTSSAKFSVPLISNWGDVAIGSELILATGSSDGAFLKAGTQVIDGALKNMAVDLENSLFGDGSGYKATIASTTVVSSKVITLTNPKDTLKFEVGMAVVPYQTYSGGALSSPCVGQTTNPQGVTIASGGLAYMLVAKVDRIGGTLTMANTLNSATGGFTDFTDGYFLANLGDVQTANPSYLSTPLNSSVVPGKILGIQAWIPYGGPSAGDSFTSAGIDRTVDPVRLAGMWMNGTAMSTAECLIKASALVSEQGGELTHFLMNSTKFSAFCSELSSKVQITNLMASPRVGFQSIEIMGADGPVKVVPCRACPSDHIFGVNMPSWTMISQRKAIYLYNLDGVSSLRQSNDSGIETRFHSYSNLICKDPRSNINILVTAA